jgi:hypothetical protein
MYAQQRRDFRVSKQQLEVAFRYRIIRFGIFSEREVPHIEGIGAARSLEKLNFVKN